MDLNIWTKRLIGFVGILLLHIYIIGSLIAAFTYTENAEWTFDTQKENSVGQVLEEWERGYLFNPIHALRVGFVAKDETESKIRKRIWITAPFVLVAFYALSFRTYWKRGEFKNASKYGSHGSARWARRREIFRRGELTGMPVNELDGAGVVLGYEKRWYGKGKYITIPPDSELNQNVIVFGGSGIGKDYTYIKTQIFHTMIPFAPKDHKRRDMMKARMIPESYSLFVVDPKGETYRDTALSLQENGYEVYAFNLVKPSASHRWNALDYVEDDLDAEKLANTIVVNSQDGHSGGDPFWPRAEKALMAAIILFVKYELPPEQQNLPNVLHIGITFGRDQEEMDMLFDSLPYNHPAVAKYNIFRTAKEETRAGILIGFGTQLSLFSNRQIADLTSQSDFRLDDMGRKKMAVFLIIPDSDTTFAPLTSLFITQAFQQWWKVADEHNGTCPVGVRVLGNEWANVGRVPMLAERTSVMRSKGVSVQIILQAKSQLDKLYKDDSDIILQNCDTIVFLGTNDKKTANEMAETLGDMTIQVTSESQSQQGMLASNQSESKQYQQRKLMDASELRRKSRKQNIIIQNGANPFKTWKTPFTKHPKSKGYAKFNPHDLVPPPHRGFELFSRSDYERIVGLSLLPSTTDANEVRAGFEQQEQEGIGILDLITDPGDTDAAAEKVETVASVDEGWLSETERVNVTSEPDVAVPVRDELSDDHANAETTPNEPVASQAKANEPEEAPKKSQEPKDVLDLI